jgi:tRNA pseudouridine38-40 synthase
MPRYFFEISYEGTNFLGWQKQAKGATVQGNIESALSKLYSMQPIPIMGCGRTDTGVHAKKYIFHADLKEKINEAQLKFKLNLMLDKKIAIHRIFLVTDDLHARFNAELRTYKYFIHFQKDAFKKDSSWWISQKLDVELMKRAGELLLGTMDFEAFSKKHTDVKSHICTVTKADFILNDNALIFEISANRFLRNMVRAIVGTLIEVGLHKINLKEFEQIIASKSRQNAAASAPASGLFLWDVLYPNQE